MKKTTNTHIKVGKGEIDVKERGRGNLKPEDRCDELFF